MAFLTDEEIEDIKENKRCPKCANTAFEDVWRDEFSTHYNRVREIDFQCLRCGFIVRYVRRRPLTGAEFDELRAADKKAELSFVDRVMAKFKELMR